MNVALSETKLTPRRSDAGALSQEMSALLAVLLRLIDHQGAVVIHMTSARTGEGTTTIARQLAASAARSKWCKVALLDGHRARADGDAGPGALAPRGLVESFEETGTAQLRRLRVGDAELGVAVLNGTWDLIPKVDSVRGLYAKLRSEYTLTIVDCPSVLDWRDTAVLASVADGTILVVEAERTRIADLERAREILEQLGATILGVVLNKRRSRIPRFIARFF